jgi:hypothetical protein
MPGIVAVIDNDIKPLFFHPFTLFKLFKLIIQQKSKAHTVEANEVKIPCYNE